MTGTGSPCGACKFLRRKCIKGCIFAPYFCYEQGATHFAAIHKVFGASNVSKLLAHIPVGDRGEAAVTIAYEAQARLQDPIYGCVSHIFALQQQVVNLQAQLASLKEQAAAQNLQNGSNYANPNYDKFQDVQSWFHQSENPSTMPQFDHSSLTSNNNIGSSTQYYGSENNYIMTSSNYHMGNNYENINLVIPKENMSSFEEGGSCSVDSSFDMQKDHYNNRQWTFQDDADDLQSVAFRYLQHT
ncbi:LOB domain-containing protein 20 [Capsicum annuum]|uniref:LOB domain-containing protein 20 n=1 Tax=Capsicum annuum TaxID=4072 RepID=A0A1U8F2P2_CAPAN|nr:LOB domain-containing protein 29 [Capsicum annuum]KAF3617460.1 LOB domain-containing protein 20 [Capsicum annuum]KAF3629850.1 LOB domain-containing protein 20 [Capsicum annuum]PHT86712.1 LOB domain-containing protein 20 [Capsicum annuum]